MHQNSISRTSTYLAQALLGNAVLFGMTADLKLSVTDKSVSPPVTDTSRLSWATSLFYFGQLAGSYPMTYAFQRFDSQYVLGPMVMLWAIICAATAGVSTWQGLFAQRFFLGMKILSQFRVASNGTYPLYRIHGIYHSDLLHGDSWWILYPVRTILKTELVVVGEFFFPLRKVGR